MADGKFYWLKLKRDFFKRHDITIIEAMPNGKDYVLFYMKLLCESVDHDGRLRFNNSIPYNEQMLSIITNTNIDIVRNAITAFRQLGMMDVLDDGTYYMNKVEEMIGSAVDNDNANRQRRYREKQKALALQESYECVTKNNESKSIEKEKELEIELERESNTHTHTYGQFKNVILSDDEYKKLKDTYPDADGMIENFSERLKAKGYQYDSHYAAICSWAKKDKKQMDDHKSGMMKHGYDYDSIFGIAQ